MQMLPAMAKLPEPSDGKPGLLVVTNGPVDLNKKTLQEAGLKCPVLVQAGMTIAEKYRVQGTPAGYLIDASGKIASGRAIGAEPLLALAGATAAEAAGGKANKGLEHSRLVRDGLKAGTPAPDFRLPKVQGGELTLKELLGQKVLLVFSDPECGPCDLVAPELEKVHRERTDLRVIVVSRREPEKTAQKIEKFGWTFPVVLQKQWEISKLYGMFATPIGYLIDEQGIIVKDVGTGPDGILGLVSN
jgi:peroxiredoxin